MMGKHHDAIEERRAAAVDLRQACINAMDGMGGVLNAAFTLPLDLPADLDGLLARLGSHQPKDRLP